MRPKPLSIAIVGAVVLMISGWSSPAAENDADLAKVQGLWERKTGHDIPGLRRATKEIRGTHEVVTYFGDEDKLLGAHEVDLNVERRNGIRIFTYSNWVGTAGPEKGHKSPQPVSYIYRADDNTFTEVWGFMPGQEGRAPLVLMWVRKVPASPDMQQEQQTLLGTWQAAAPPAGSKEGAESFGDQLMFHSDDLVIRRNNRAHLSGVFRLDPTKTPRQIDLIVTQSPDGAWNGQTIHGIYELTAEQLRWCSSLPNHPRPQAFTPVEGSSQILLVLHRESRPARG